MLRRRHVRDGPCARERWRAATTGFCLIAGCLRAHTQSTAPGEPLVTASSVEAAQKAAPADVRSGSISGTVLTGPAVGIAGAQINLLQANGATRITLSDAEGHFAISDVPPGTCTLQITLAGFDPATTPIVLGPGQSYALSPVTLKLATVNITIDATASQKELAVEQLHTEEHQRIVGFLPNFFVSYNWDAPPMTTRQKYTLAWKNVMDPGNLLLVGTTAGVQQAVNSFPGYRQGAAGYGKRYGADLGNLVGGTFMGGAVLPSLFHQDPRYFYKGTGTVRSRILYAVSTAVICRGDNGRRQPAFASVLGDLSAGAISNLYYAPSDRQGATLTIENGLLGIAGDAMNDLVEEFVLHKFTTKGARKKDTSP